jgi:hypothetical protein
MIKLKTIFGFTALIFISSTASAFDYNSNFPSGIYEKTSNYESSFGTKYQYDLSDPSDSIDYSVDLDAQMRDQLSVDPNRNLDRGMNEYGGGIYE